MTILSTPIIRVRVRDAMHTGILSTDPQTPLHTVARLMSERRVHAVAVADPDDGQRPWGIITDLDLVAAATSEEKKTAGQAVRHEVVPISENESLDWAARQMVRHGLTHLLVIEPKTGHPSGIISALDIAAAYAG